MVEEKKNELANEEEQLMEESKLKSDIHIPQLKMLWFRLISISTSTYHIPQLKSDKFNFPIEFVTLAMEEDQHVSSIGKPPNATSQAWIDTKHGEMTLLVGEEKVKFYLL